MLGRILLVFILLSVWRKCRLLPVGSREGIEVPPPDVLKFMRRFGYLEPNPDDSEALYHESAIVEAIKNIQKYGALNQTGKLDQPTVDLLKKPRCGVPDIEGKPYYLKFQMPTPPTSTRKKRFILGARTWAKRHISYFIGNWSLKIPRQQVERDVFRAFALWASHSNLRFERINDTSADIIIGFGSRYHGDNFPFDGPGNILAHAYYPYEMGSWGGDVHFDEDENWMENSTDLATGVDFYSVAAHELGHSLGLAHSPTYTSIMFPYYKGPGHNVLNYDDTLAMYEAYVKKQLDDDYSDIEPIKWTKQETVTTTPFPLTTTSTRTNSQELVTTQHVDEDEISAFTTNTTTERNEKEHRASKRIPNICLGKFDAVCRINGSVHIFKKAYVWKISNHYRIISGFPHTIYEEFSFLPSYVKRIDACYERYDGSAVFFVGQQFWVFRGKKTKENSPKPLRDLIGNTMAITHINAAMVWPKNNFTYIFAKSVFWRYDDRSRLLSIGYPKSMTRWPGVPNNIDAATTLQNGKTYFFKGNFYWLYDNTHVRPERGYPRRASIAWLGCNMKTTKTPLRNFNTTVAFISSSVSF